MRSFTLEVENVIFDDSRKTKEGEILVRRLHLHHEAYKGVFEDNIKDDSRRSWTLYYA